ncbi:MAG: flagellar capping protein FliD [Alphaproteobacteria bacterium]|jgi:flagellar capping protein FliD
MIEGLNVDNLTVDDSGRVSLSGLGSGIDIRGTVDAIIGARRIPVDTLETRVATNLDKIAALETLQGGLDTLKTSLSRLYGQLSLDGSSDIFEIKQAFASSFRIDGTSAAAAGNLVGITVSNEAATGSHTIEVLQTARTNKISSDAIASTTTPLGFASSDEFSITSDQTRTSFNTNVQANGTVVLGSAGTLQFTDDNGNLLGTINYLATDTLDDIAAAIGGGVTGMTAEVTSVSGGVRLELTSSTEFRISEIGAGSVLTDFELGTRKIAVSSDTNLLDLRDSINAANSGTNATGINASIVRVNASESFLVLTAEDTGVIMSLAETSGTPLSDVGILTAGGAINNELQAAQNALLYADGLLDQTNKTYETELQSASTTQIGSTGQFTFTRDSDSGTITTLNYTNTDDLDALATAINGNVSLTADGIAAEVVSDGAGVRLEIIGTAGFTITESGAGTAIADLGIDNKRRVIERSSNTIDDLFAGITLSLFAAEQGTTISLSVEQDLSQVKAEIFTFVDAYNSVRQFINENRLVDKATGAASEESGILFSSGALDQVSQALGVIIGQGTPGVDQRFSVLSQIGVDFIKFGESDPLLAENLEINETRLDAALLSNADDVQKLFSFDFTSSDSRITLLAFDGNTSYSSAGYTLNLQPSSGSNLLLQSEAADDAAWTAQNSTVSANAITAPDGSLTADGLVADATNATHFLTNAGAVTLTAGETYVYSTYVKAGDRADARIALSGAAFGTSQGADFDLSLGTVTSTDNGIEEATIEDVGDGWFRVSVKASAVATGDAFVESYAKDTTTSFTGDGATVSTYFWGAQLEPASVTTTTLTNADVTPTRASITADILIPTDPDGGTTADSLVADATLGTHLVSNTAAISVTAGEQYDYTTFVQAGDRSRVRLNMTGAGFSANTSADFDLAGGTVLATGAAADSAAIEAVGAGWFKVTVTGTATATGTVNLELSSLDAALGDSFSGDGATASTHFWDQRLVQKSSPESYIATTATAISGVTPSANIDGVADGLDDSSVSVNGNILAANSGGTEGLRLFFDGFSGFATSIQLDFTIGVAAQMFFKLEELLAVNTGVVDGEIDQLTDQNIVHNDRIEEMLIRLDIQRTNLLQRYISMETSIATANNIIESLRATTERLAAG